MNTGVTAGAGALSGLRILDLTAVVMGPYATQVLGDLGADIVKVEPLEGDNLRGTGPMRHSGMGAMSLHLNRNKRSIALDLKQLAGLQACLRLAKGCDALVFNIRPSSMARLGLNYDAVRAANPRIVYLAMVGYGQSGPYAGRPAYDDLIQGAVGIPSLLEQQGADCPRYAPVTLADRVSGLHGAIGLLAAVMHARATGQGQSVEIPMFEAVAQLVMGDHLAGQTFEPPLGPPGYSRLLAPHRRPYRTADGYLSVLIYNDKQWRAFFDVIGRADLLHDPMFSTHAARVAHVSAVYAFVAEVMLTRTSQAWTDTLLAADIPTAPMHSMVSLIDDPHLSEVGFFRTVDHPTEGLLRTPAPVGNYSATPAALHRPAPRIGEHSVELLREAGYDDREIDALVASRVTLRHSLTQP